jgi:hypothetical protein
MDLNKLTTGDKVIGVSGILLLLFNFFPQFGKGGYSEGAGFLGWLAVLFGLVAVAGVVVEKLTTTEIPKLPISTDHALLALGGLAALLEIVQLVIGRSYGVLGYSVTLDREFGLFLAVLASIGLAVGGFLRTRESAGSTSTPPASPQV